MKKHLILLVSLMVISTSASAEFTDKEYCAISGYYEGSKNNFMYNITVGIRTKKDLRYESTCKVEYDFGVAVGKQFLIRQSDVFSEPESLRISLKAYEFEKNVFNRLS